MPDAPTPPPWQVLRSELLIDTPHLRLRRDQIQTPRGDVVDGYHVRETRGFSVIFALTPAGEVVVVRQYKYGIDRVVTELPGGAIDAGETPLAAAVRELAEETGFAVPSGLELVRDFIVDPTSSNGRFFLFYGAGAVPTARPQFDPTEEIEVRLIPLDSLRSLVRDGIIEVAYHTAAIYTVLERLGRL